MSPFKLTSKQNKLGNTVIEINGVSIGDSELVVMAGPCAVESREQVMEVAEIVKSLGANIMRGGAFKPRTTPYDFQGLAEKGLKILAEASEKYNIPIVTEVMDARDIDMVASYAHILQVGSRNMQNFSLLKDLGKVKNPILLKRGLSATIHEWLWAAEYIMANGNPNVILCERGIRTFENHTRNTLDLSAVLAIKELSHLPVIVDPSHATGKWEMVIPLSRAAVAVGADGLIVEVHPDPPNALCDGRQSLTPENFGQLMEEIKLVGQAVGKTTTF
jgi:3-deoxy-7-phosphoheptulonate synthase